MVVYDTTYRESFESARKWIDELRANSNNQDMVVALVGNKSDLADQMQVTAEEAHGLKEECKLDILMETSAKDNNGVQDLFIVIANRLLRKHKAQTVSCMTLIFIYLYRAFKREVPGNNLALQNLIMRKEIRAEGKRKKDAVEIVKLT